MTLDDRVRIPKEVVSRTVGDETVLLNLETQSYYGLDPVGGRVWTLLGETGNLRAVFESMASEYEVAEQDLERDILRLVLELHAKGLLQSL